MKRQRYIKGFPSASTVMLGFCLCAEGAHRGHVALEVPLIRAALAAQHGGVLSIGRHCMRELRAACATQSEPWHAWRYSLLAGYKTQTQLSS